MVSFFNRNILVLFFCASTSSILAKTVNDDGSTKTKPILHLVLRLAQQLTIEPAQPNTNFAAPQINNLPRETTTNRTAAAGDDDVAIIARAIQETEASLQEAARRRAQLLADEELARAQDEIAHKIGEEKSAQTNLAGWALCEDEPATKKHRGFSAEAELEALRASSGTKNTEMLAADIAPVLSAPETNHFLVRSTAEAAAGATQPHDATRIEAPVFRGAEIESEDPSAVIILNDHKEVVSARTVLLPTSPTPSILSAPPLPMARRQALMEAAAHAARDEDEPAAAARSEEVLFATPLSPETRSKLKKLKAGIVKNEITFGGIEINIIGKEIMKQLRSLISIKSSCAPSYQDILKLLEIRKKCINDLKSLLIRAFYQDIKILNGYIFFNQMILLLSAGFAEPEMNTIEETLKSQLCDYLTELEGSNRELYSKLAQCTAHAFMMEKIHDGKTIFFIKANPS